MGIPQCVNAIEILCGLLFFFIACFLSLYAFETIGRIDVFTLASMTKILNILALFLSSFSQSNFLERDSDSFTRKGQLRLENQSWDGPAEIKDKTEIEIFCTASRSCVEIFILDASFFFFRLLF